jgi:hypothetical protein
LGLYVSGFAIAADKNEAESAKQSVIVTAAGSGHIDHRGGLIEGNTESEIHRC